MYYHLIGTGSELEETQPQGSNKRKLAQSEETIKIPAKKKKTNAPEKAATFDIDEITEPEPDVPEGEKFTHGRSKRPPNYQVPLLIIQIRFDL